jgi:esterase/lipase
LQIPDRYIVLLHDQCDGLDQLVATATRTQLLTNADGVYLFHTKLRDEHHFDVIRLENPIKVSANEIAPLHRVRHALEQVLRHRAKHDQRSLAMQKIDDELLSFHYERAQYDKPQHAAINAQQAMTENGVPVLLEGDGRQAVGVVLVHGFLASPAELRVLAEEWHTAGHTVYLVRLKVHGTSPWDLREHSYADWFACVQRGVEIIQGLCEKAAVVGFSTGGSLALYTAGQCEVQSALPLSGVCAICVPVCFQDPQMRYVPLVHGVNRLVRSLSSMDGVTIFTKNESENPHINYRHIPMRGLYELRLLVKPSNMTVFSTYLSHCAKNIHSIRCAVGCVACKRCSQQRCLSTNKWYR